MSAIDTTAAQDMPGFTRGNLFRHVSVMAFTASVGLVAIFAVDLVDIVFISMLGQEALAAAAGYASAVMFFASAINIGLSIAAGALVARAIGAGDRTRARETATSVAVLAVAVGVLVPLLTLPFIDALLAILGAGGATRDMAATYLWIILPTTVLSGLGMVAVAVLRAHGDARGAMYPALVGGAVNAILDPLLIFTLGLGLNGAAAATVLARLVTMALAFARAQGRYAAFCPPSLGCVVRDCVGALRIAAPAVLSTVATPLGGAIVTREMAQFGPDAVAGMAVINRMVPVVFAVIFALSSAIGPILGQNFGADRLDRVARTFWNGLIFAALYVVIVAALLYAFRAPIADLFGATGTMRQLIYLYCGPLALAAFFNAAIFVSNAAFNNLGHPGYATVVNWGRNTLGTWPLAVLGAALAGAPGVLIGQAAGGVLFAGIAVWMGRRVIADPCEEPIPNPFRYADRRMQVLVNRAVR